MYKESELVRIAKRENNNKRKYLVVNKLQGKHIPVKPSSAIAMFTQLGDILKKNYGDERLLLIGFSETATAIGASISVQNSCFYMQTTREKINNVEYLLFSEAHSHATEQRLVRNDIDVVINKIDRIVFIEDEVTTGNTIMNIVRLIDQIYPNKVKFSVASLLNGMNSESIELFKNFSINIHYLVKTNHDHFEKIANQTKDNGKYEVPEKSQCSSFYIQMVCNGFVDARRLVAGKEYLLACNLLWNQISEQIDFTQHKKILVLGTEEFMFPAMFVGKKIEDQGKEVWFHATTRSPIAVSKQDEYPLHTRYELNSMYAEDRITYVYNIDKYDVALVITDSSKVNNCGINGIMNTLEQNGNVNNFYIRWI